MPHIEEIGEKMHHIGEVEDKISFRSVVLSDLHNLGIKVHKPRRKSGSHAAKEKQGSSSQSSAAPTSPSIFQRPLDEVPSSIADDELLGHMFVPSFLVEAFEYLGHHYNLEGIFRKSGSVQRQKELKSRIESGRFDFSDAQPNDVTSVVKEFFRNLPEPLLPFHFHHAFFKVMSFPDDLIDESTSLTKEDAMSLLCCLLPMSHLTTLRFVLNELKKISRCVDENKMDVTNLSVIMTPNFMPAPKDDSKSGGSQGDESKTLNRRTGVVTMLLGMAEKIGSVPVSIFERARMMSSLFPSAAAAASNGDVGDEDSMRDDDKPKLKRKKRSASFSGLVSGLSEGFAWLKGSRNNLNSNYNVTCEPIHRPAHLQHYDPAGLPPATPRNLYTPQPPRLEPYTPKIMVSNQGNAHDGGSLKRRAALIGNLTNSPLLPVTPSVKGRPHTANASPLLPSRQSRRRHRGHHQDAPILSVSDAIKHKRNSSGGRIEGSKSKPRSPDADAETSAEEIKVGKQRRARSLIKILGNSFRSEENLTTSKSDVSVNNTSVDSASSLGSKLRKSGFFNRSRRHNKHPSSPAGTTFKKRNKEDNDSTHGLRATRSSDDLMGEDEDGGMVSIGDQASSLSTPACLDGVEFFSNVVSADDDVETTKSSMEEEEDDVGVAPMPVAEEINLVNRFLIGLEDMEGTISLSPAPNGSGRKPWLNPAIPPGCIQTPGKGQIMSYLTKMSGINESEDTTEEMHPRRRIIESGFQSSYSRKSTDVVSSPGFGQYFLPRTPGSSAGSPCGVTRRRSLSEGDMDAIFAFARVSGLKRGKPNSQQVGLMSPLLVDEKRRSWRGSLSGMHKLEEDVYGESEKGTEESEMGGDVEKEVGDVDDPFEEDGGTVKAEAKGASHRFRDGMKDLADRYHEMEVEMEEEARSRCGGEEEEDGESIQVGDVSGQTLTSASSYASLRSDASKSSLHSVHSHDGSVLKGESDESLGEPSKLAERIVEESSSQEAEMKIETVEDNSSLLRAIEEHLRANRLMDSGDVIANVEVLEEDGDGDDSASNQEGLTILVNNVETSGVEANKASDDVEQEEKKGRKVKRRKSLKEANITVTKGTHGVLERTKMLSKIPDVQLQPVSPIAPKTASALLCGRVLESEEEKRRIKRGSVSNLQGSGKVAQRVARFQQISASNTDKFVKKSTLAAIQSRESNLPRMRTESRPSPSKSRPTAAALHVKALTSRSTPQQRRPCLPVAAGSMVRPVAEQLSGGGEGGVGDDSDAGSKSRQGPAAASAAAAAAKPHFLPSVPSVKNRSGRATPSSSSIPVYSRKFQSPVRDAALKDQTNVREEPTTKAAGAPSIELLDAGREKAGGGGGQKRQLGDKTVEPGSLSPRKSPKPNVDCGSVGSDSAQLDL